MQRVVTLSNELTRVLIDMEKHGCKIDLEELQKLKTEYELEAQQLDKELQELAREAVGDTPINLGSPEQLSWLLFSRKPKDKKQWAEVFNLGIDEERGKPKRPKKMKEDTFGRYINALTDIQYKTRKEKCDACKGFGKVAKLRKDGTYGSPRFNCTSCGGSGVIYIPLKEVAGFKLIPRDTFDLATHGFKTDADVLKERISEAKGSAKQFIEKMVRYNAVTFYISTFIGGIEKFISGDGLLRANFMQTITATGRLSSQRPNLYNQPRGSTFPVKRCFVSRWPEGLLLDVDFSTLEFCVAAELSNDPRAFQDIADRVDVHIRTSDILTKSGQPTNRQDSKAHTFKPLKMAVVKSGELRGHP